MDSDYFLLVTLEDRYLRHSPYSQQFFVVFGAEPTLFTIQSIEKEYLKRLQVIPALSTRTRKFIYDLITRVIPTALDRIAPFLNDPKGAEDVMEMALMLYDQPKIHANKTAEDIFEAAYIVINHVAEQLKKIHAQIVAPNTHYENFEETSLVNCKVCKGVAQFREENTNHHFCGEKCQMIHHNYQ